MKKISLGRNSWVPVILVLLVEVILITLIVTVWPAYG